ncbi:hypothetical protein RhiirA1_532002 [Rhizophagus irregularis]|uniref:Uncharacterized protein n=1 Tax=Rhizophagus irregularis TaxID=588596 RepID=A0A2N0S786_9GLOM|nr:hypothetical protein RhiirA1_532002 [Rhizophagus irregularis]
MAFHYETSHSNPRDKKNCCCLPVAVVAVAVGAVGAVVVAVVAAAAATAGFLFFGSISFKLIQFSLKYWCF